jgi:hypothetical protein
MAIERNTSGRKLSPVACQHRGTGPQARTRWGAMRRLDAAA